MTTPYTSLRTPSALVFSSGYDVLAKDGIVGSVVRPLFRPGEYEPSFLVVRLRGVLRKRTRTVPASFVSMVDDSGQAVRLSVKRRTILRLPQRLALRSLATPPVPEAPEPDIAQDALEKPATGYAEIVDRRMTDVTHVLSLRGTFQDDDVPSLTELLRGVIRAGAKQLIVDVRELEALSPRCLDVVAACSDRLNAADGQLLLATPGPDENPYYLTAIDTSDLTRLRGLQDGLDRALAG